MVRLHSPQVVRITITSKLDPSKANVYTIDANLSAKELKRCEALLCNPLIETTGLPRHSGFTEIGFLPGVTDNVGNTATEMLGHKVYFSQIYFRNPPPYNPLIQRASKDKPLPVPHVMLPKPRPAQIINLDVSDEELIKISKERTLALDLASMKAIQSHKKNPTDVELEALAQTWSEHCKHTIFADPLDEIKDGLYRHYIKAATKKINKKFCVSVFSDNSGAIAFDENYLVTHKVETHNTPSALDPFGGAITGIVGVNRDAMGFGMGAKPITNTYGFCLGYPDDKRTFYRDAKLKQPMLSARRIMDGVVAGINAGGNQSGIPTPDGFLYFDDRYRGKPLVFAGTVGLIPRRIKGKLSHIKKALPGDYVVMVGGRVGQDGMRGAMFSSEEIHARSSNRAVQIGDPITQKKMSDAIIKEARNRGLYHSITDNGAGGLSSSIGEMAEQSGGAEVELDKVPLKYPGLEPWQIWISESQERMTLAIPPKNWKKFHDLMERRGVEATVIGKFTKSGRCVVTYHGKTVMDLELDFLHNGRPIKIQKSKKPTGKIKKIPPFKFSKQKLLGMLAHPNMASYEFLSKQYDHTVQATGVVGPLQGKGNINGNAQVLAPVLGSKKGIVLSHSLWPELGEIDPYTMAECAIDAVMANVTAIGGDPDQVALLDNFCWCSSNDPERLWQLKEACRGCYDTAVAYGAPFISGKDSMFNDFKGFDAQGEPVKISVPPTLLISAIAIIPDVTKAVTEDFKNDGDLVYILSGISAKRFHVDAKKNLAQYRKLYQAIQKNLIASAVSVGRGGGAVALAKSAMGGMLGVTIRTLSQKELLGGGIFLSIRPEHRKVFEKAVPAKLIGAVGGEDIKIGNMKVSVAEALATYKSTFKNF